MGEYNCNTCKNTDRCESCMKEYKELIDLGFIVPENNSEEEK